MRARARSNQRPHSSYTRPSRCEARRRSAAPPTALIPTAPPPPPPLPTPQAAFDARLQQLLAERMERSDLEGLEGKPRGARKNMVEAIKLEVM